VTLRKASSGARVSKVKVDCHRGFKPGYMREDDQEEEEEEEGKAHTALTTWECTNRLID